MDIFNDNEYKPYCENVAAIANLDLLSLTYDQITGSGYFGAL